MAGPEYDESNLGKLIGRGLVDHAKHTLSLRKTAFRKLRDARGTVVDSIDLGGNADDGELSGIEIRGWNAKSDESENGAAKRAQLWLSPPDLTSQPSVPLSSLPTL